MLLLLKCEHIFKRCTLILCQRLHNLQYIGEFREIFALEVFARFLFELFLQCGGITSVVKDRCIGGFSALGDDRRDLVADEFMIWDQHRTPPEQPKNAKVLLPKQKDFRWSE